MPPKGKPKRHRKRLVKEDKLDEDPISHAEAEMGQVSIKDEEREKKDGKWLVKQNSSFAAPEKAACVFFSSFRTHTRSSCR